MERHRTSLLFVAVALTLAGVFAGINLPVSLFPVVSFPRIRVVIDSSSMPSQQMLVEVTEPLEAVARAVPGATDVESKTSRGSAEIFVDFPWGSNMRQALQSVDTAFAQKLPDLPVGTVYDALQMSPTAIAPFVSYALLSDKESPSKLRQLAQYRIAPLLTGIPGVKKVGVLGGNTPEVQVHIASATLQAYGLSVDAVAKAISQTNSLNAVGRIQDNSLLFLTIENSSFKDIQSVKDVMLRTSQGNIVRLGDIASIEMGSVPKQLLVNDNGHPAVTFDVYQQDKANSVTLQHEVQHQLDTFMKGQPKSIRLYKWYDQTELVNSSIKAVEEAILIGIVFAACVIFGFLRNWRATAVAMLAVPMSVLVTCVVLKILGMTFNIMTLGGIAASIGLLIDDAIVMIEQIARRAAVPGLAEPKRTVLAAAREFLAPLTGSSLATIVMFIPLAFLSGVSGAFFKFLSLTMASSLVISYGLTALVVPLLARGIIDFEKWQDPSHGRETFSRRTHRRALTMLAARPWLLGIGILAIIAVGYAGYANVGTGFLPKMDEGGFVLDYQTAPGTSLGETNRELSEVEKILKDNPYVANYSRRIGAGLGGDFVESYQGDFFVKLVGPSKRPPIWTVMDSLTSQITSQVPGISFDTHQLMGDMIGDMVGRRQPVVINLSAQDPGDLPKIAKKVAGAIAKVPGIQPASINDGVVPAGDALEIRVDPVVAAANDLTSADVQAQVRNYLKGDVVTSYLGSLRKIGVRLWAGDQNAKTRRDDLENLPIKSSNGHLVTLGTVARIKFEAGQPELTRDNLAQVVSVTAEIGGGHDLGSTVAAVKSVLDAQGFLPDGVYYRIGGAYKQQQIAARGMMEVFIAAIIAETVLLLFLYERLSLALTIIFTSIVSTGAVFTGLWVAHIELNITAMMGMVMIVGIATEMAIFLVSEFQALSETMPAREAIFEAALNRLRPIAMSSLAMILALLPLGAAISGSGDQMLQPLAVAIIAGTIVQLPMVLLALPVLIAATLPRRSSVGAENPAPTG